MVLGRLTTGGAAVGRGAAVATQEIPSLHSGEPEPKEAVVISTQVDLRQVQAPYDDDVVAMNSRSPSWSPIPLSKKKPNDAFAWWILENEPKELLIKPAPYNFTEVPIMLGSTVS